MIKTGRNDPCPCGSGKKYKKCCLNKPKRMVHETLEKFLGKEWIEKELAKVKLSGYKNLNPMNLAALDIHPVIKAIVETQTKLNFLKESKQQYFPIGRAESLQNLLHLNLNLLEPVLDPSSIQRRLRDKNEFVKAEYEIAIAAGYRRMGLEIEILPCQIGKRTGEFYVFDSSENKVLVECKKKDMTSPKQQKISAWWEEFQHLMIQSLRKQKKCYSVLVSIPMNPERTETHKLKNEIEKTVVADQEGEFSFLSDKFKVILKCFCEKGQSVPAEVFNAFGNDRDFGAIVLKQSKDAWPIGRNLPKEYFDPIGVYAKGPSNFIDEKVISVIRTIGDAYGQLEEDKPNLVYVDMNISLMTPKRINVLLRKLIPAVSEKLSRDYSKITAVILTNLKLLGHSEVSGFRANEHLILNPKAKVKLPPGFKIYGDIKSGISILRDVAKLLTS